MTCSFGIVFNINEGFRGKLKIGTKYISCLWYKRIVFFIRKILVSVKKSIIEFIFRAKKVKFKSKQVCRIQNQIASQTC